MNVHYDRNQAGEREAEAKRACAHINATLDYEGASPQYVAPIREQPGYYTGQIVLTRRAAANLVAVAVLQGAN